MTYGLIAIGMFKVPAIFAWGKTLDNHFRLAVTFARGTYRSLNVVVRFLYQRPMIKGQFQGLRPWE